MALELRTLSQGMKKLVYTENVMVYSSVAQMFLLMDSFWVQKITMEPHILAHINRASR